MMNKPETLVILTPGFPANEADSTCIPPQQIFVKTLKKNYPALNIIVLAFQYPFILKNYKWNGINVQSFNGQNKEKLYRVMVWLKVWRALNKIKKENNVTGFLSFWLGECALIGKYFGKINGIKQFTWILGQDAKRGNKYFYFTKPSANNLIALSDFVADEFLKNYGTKPHWIIPVGIDVSMFTNEQYKRNIDVIGAGSLIALKQYDVFINIIKELKFYFPNIYAVVCGDGNEKENLQSLIEKKDLKNNVTLAGEVSHEKVIELMQHSKIFFHTSSYEGFGMVCTEALYAGCQVISFTKPMKENIKHWHVVNNEEEMIEKAFEILSYTSTQYSSVLFQPVEKTVKEIMNLFLQ